MSNSGTTSCLKCKTILPFDIGFVAWCHECGWNVDPDKPIADPGGLGKIYDRFWAVQGERLLAEFVAHKEDDLRPRHIGFRDFSLRADFGRFDRFARPLSSRQLLAVRLGYRCWRISHRNGNRFAAEIS